MCSNTNDWGLSRTRSNKNNVRSTRLSLYVGTWVLIVLVSQDQPSSSETGSLNQKLSSTPRSWSEDSPKFKVAHQTFSFKLLYIVLKLCYWFCKLMWVFTRSLLAVCNIFRHSSWHTWWQQWDTLKTEDRSRWPVDEWIQYRLQHLSSSSKT